MFGIGAGQDFGGIWYFRGFSWLGCTLYLRAFDSLVLLLASGGVC